METIFPFKVMFCGAVGLGMDVGNTEATRGLSVGVEITGFGGNWPPQPARRTTMELVVMPDSLMD